MQTVKSLADALQSAISDLEHFGPSLPPGHVCGPESNCDGLCMDVASFSQRIQGYREALASPPVQLAYVPLEFGDTISSDSVMPDGITGKMVPSTSVGDVYNWRDHSFHLRPITIPAETRPLDVCQDCSNDPCICCQTDGEHQDKSTPPVPAAQGLYSISTATADPLPEGELVATIHTVHKMRTATLTPVPSVSAPLKVVPGSHPEPFFKTDEEYQQFCGWWKEHVTDALLKSPPEPRDERSAS